MGVGVSKPAAVTAAKTFGLKPSCEKLIRRWNSRGPEAPRASLFHVIAQFLLQRFVWPAQGATEAKRPICPALLASQIMGRGNRRKGLRRAAQIAEPEVRHRGQPMRLDHGILHRLV